MTETEEERRARIVAEDMEADVYIEAKRLGMDTKSLRDQREFERRER